MNTSALKMPKRMQTEGGKERRVGVELELSGLSYKALISHMEMFLGAEATEEERYTTKLITDHGNFIVELDSAQVKDFDPDTSPLPDAVAEVADKAMALVDAAAEQVVPLEIVGPPMNISALPLFDSLTAFLYEHGALGSRHALYYAFGLQLNPELPDLDPATILGYMRAFALSYAWLKERQQLDISRKFTSYIGPWPDKYTALIIAEDYRPDLAALIDDYLQHNPTRNRALDMLPLFAHLDADRVKQSVSDNRIKPRPTLHYRLPDCDVDNPKWSFNHVWNDWVRVDNLAGDDDALRKMSDAWMDQYTGGIEHWLTRWQKTSQTWLGSLDS